MKTIGRLAALLCAPALLPAAVDAQVWPSRPVHVLVGSPAGGPSDVLTRGAAQVLGQVTGQPFVVENRVGAETMISGEACARAAPNGYTFCTGDNASLIATVVRAKMPYDLFRDLSPVIFFGYLGSAILVHPSVPANSWKELLALAASKPQGITWGSYGVASISTLYIEWLKSTKNVSFYNVPYKAASLAWPAMLAGEVQVSYFAAGPAARQVKAGKAKALLVVTDTRSPQMPDVPTYKEEGLDLAMVSWFGLYAPAGTPREIVLRVNSELASGLLGNAALKEKFLTSLGIQTDPPAGASPEAFASFILAERGKYLGVAKAAGLKKIE